MKILMIIDYYMPVWGGSQIQLRQLIKHLTKLDCNVTIITRRWQPTMNPFSTVDGTPVHRVGWPGHNVFATCSYLFGLLFYVIKNNKQIDLIHTHGAAALGAVGKILASVTRKRNIAKVSSSKRIPQLQKQFLGWAILKIFAQSDAIIGFSEQICHQLTNINTPTNHINRIPNGVDTARFHPVTNEQKKLCKTEKGFSPEDQIIIYSGRLIKGKGLNFLIDTWPKVLSVVKNAKLVLLGSGKYGSEIYQNDSIEDKLRKKIAQRNLQQIIFAGETKSPELFLQAADIFVFPSRSEGMSNVLLEAMSCNLGVVASDIKGNQNLIRNNVNGLLVPLDDTDALAETLISLLTNPDKCNRLGSKARKVVIKNYTFQKIARKYYILYQSLLAHTTEN